MPTIPYRAIARNSLRYLLYTICALAALLLSFCAAPLYATYQRTKRYLVPGTELDPRPRTAAMGYPATGILRSVRTGRGRSYGDDTIHFLVSVLDEAEADGLTTVEVVIQYQRLNVTVTYATTIEALRAKGQRVLGVSGWELALSRQLWSVDGQAPEGMPTPKPETEARAEQPMLFAFDEPRKVGAY